LLFFNNNKENKKINHSYKEIVNKITTKK
jgi:hypothetical protein